MTRRMRLARLGVIAPFALVVPVSTQRGTPRPRTQTGPQKLGGIRWALGLE